MSQHFLLSAEARSLSVREIFTLSDDNAFELFRELRWGKGDMARLFRTNNHATFRHICS